MKFHNGSLSYSVRTLYMWGCMNEIPVYMGRSRWHQNHNHIQTWSCNWDLHVNGTLNPANKWPLISRVLSAFKARQEDLLQGRFLAELSKESLLKKLIIIKDNSLHGRLLANKLRSLFVRNWWLYRIICFTGDFWLNWQRRSCQIWRTANISMQSIAFLSTAAKELNGIF